MEPAIPTTDLTISPFLVEGLNDAQREAVLAGDGPILVVAGPGSGKTRVLTNRIAHLISDRGTPPYRILAVTFTNKAAKEMRDRIDRLLGSESAQGLVMGTFHSFGVRVLRQNAPQARDKLGLQSRFTIYDDTDQNALAKQSLVNIGLDPKQVPPRRMLSRVSAAKSVLLTPDDLGLQTKTYDEEVITRFYREYQRLLHKANAVDFDDLLMLPIQLFDAEPAVLDRYQEQFLHLLVDEYQDTNRVQYVLVSALTAKHRNLFVVGDPDQSIYGWRQADIRNILDFERDFPDARRIDLEINYRSTRHIVAVADQVIRDNKERIDRSLRTENDEGELINLRELADQNHEAQFVVDEIRRLRQMRGYDAEQVAVMYRTVSQSRVLEEAFRLSGIPYRIIGGVRFYDRKEVKDLISALRLLHNPADGIAFRRVIDEFPLGRGIGPKAIDAMEISAALTNRNLLQVAIDMSTGAVATPPEMSRPAANAVIKLGTVFRTLLEAVGEVKLTELFDMVIDLTGYQTTFDLQVPEEAERWGNALELRSDLEDYDDVIPAEALATYLEQVSLVSAVDDPAIQEGGKVTLITLHSAKGLEFPVVFLTGVEEGLLPVSRAVEEETTNPAGIEEERRLFYVGITRAEQLLYITYTGSRVSYGRFQNNVPSRFLKAIPSSSMNEVGIRRRGFSAPSSLTSQVRAGSERYFERSTAESSHRRVVPVYLAGQDVFHAKFGEGIIMEAKERNGDQELAVDFKRHGVKRLLASLAPLELL